MARSAKGGDTVPARLQPGEFVVKRAAVKKLGDKALRVINKGRLPKRKPK